MLFRNLPTAVRVNGWFLFLSYFLGGPAFAFAEFQYRFVSGRFGYSPGFVYLVCLVQFVCAFLLFSRRLAPWSAAVLTFIAVGAVASHLKIHSPLTALPALGYTLLQAWFGYHAYRRARLG